MSSGCLPARAQALEWDDLTHDVFEAASTEAPFPSSEI